MGILVICNTTDRTTYPSAVDIDGHSHHGDGNT